MGDIADQTIDQVIDAEAEAMFARQAARQRAEKCPICGRRPKAKHTQYGWRRDCCGLWGWGEHAPLVDAATHAARQYAHRVFDGLWQKEGISRSRAYALLAEEMGLHPDDCHMKLMDKETAQRVPAATHAIWKRLRGDPT